MLRISTITQIICIIILELVILDLGKTEHQAFHNNKTQDESPWKLDRQKRSRIDSMPSRLRITLKDGDGNKIFIKWERQRQFLVNKYLPIITPLADLNLNIMEDIGEMLMYHDQNENSAVVYFEKSNQFLGLLGTDHYIQDLPNYFDDDGNYRLECVGEPYVVKLNNKFPHDAPFGYLPAPSDWLDKQEIPRTSKNNIPSNSGSNKRPITELNMGPNKKYSSNLEAGPSKKQSTSFDSVRRNSLSDPNVNAKNPNAKGTDAAETNEEQCVIGHIKRRQNFLREHHYLKTLVFVDLEIVAIFKKAFGNEYIPWIVRYYIIFFNAVDMLIAKLQLCVYLSGLHLNIAKIVIEDSLVPLKFLEHDVVEFSKIVANTREYLFLFRDVYPQDSFDHVFITSRRQIMDKYRKVDGLTSHGADMYEAIKNDRFHSAVPITVMRFKSYYADYIRAAPEFARLFGVTYDSWEKGAYQSGQCYSIMQRGGPKCDNCMLWSDESKKQFTDFIHNNRYYCFLLNEPRSLLPSGVIELSSPTKICHCLGYSYYKHISMDTWGIYDFGCNHPLQCLKDKNRPFTTESIGLPFDGTPCKTNHVCWERQCKPVTLQRNEYHLDRYSFTGRKIKRFI